MKNKLPKICYWCGNALTEDLENKEHVPPLAFFPKGHRNNLMTVPACEKHNNSFSELDEKFQFFIKAFKTNSVAKKDLEDRVLRGLQRKEKQSFIQDLEKNSRYGTIYGKSHFFLSLKENEAEMFIEKIVRGIYFYHHEKPAKGIIHSVSKRIVYEDFNTIAAVFFIKEDLHPALLKEGEYNNPEVFRYKYFAAQGLFTIFMDFYEHAEFIGIVYPEGFTFD
ncbi:hypothetical protein AR438_11035 [Chryseobacterium aquaticum]|uniref:HNH endonuclease 5 domain-containing protein n=1 Tax=Chryseobacterium aquaticum TaxID=452084 RepID=A0A0Q3K8Z8_9FLAO|nr:hypothetical protein [Chryseobacterium aquaticum]KQK26107.1 hypothetical protein AR438_11035 [Chryseobacterium aquaticum]